MKILLACAFLVLVLGSTPALAGGPSAAGPNVTTYRGGGWTLTLRPGGAPQSLVGSFSSTSQRERFSVKGDWIPAADQGGYLLRLYGHPFGPSSPTGLVGVATLYNTCNPSCAGSRTYLLKEVVSPQLSMLSRTLPGAHVATLRVVLQP